MEDRIRIKFELTDMNGNNYVSETTTEIYFSIGDTELSTIGEQLNAFLRQCGYIRKNDFMFMEDITEEECEALEAYLKEYRNDNDEE